MGIEQVEVFETKRKDTSKVDSKLKPHRFIFNGPIEVWINDKLVYKTGE